MLPWPGGKVPKSREVGLVVAMGPTTPVPVKGTESGLLVASLGISRLALLNVVAESGLNVTCRVQLPFGAIA